MNIETKQDIKTTVLNSGLVEFFEEFEIDDFVNFVWDNADLSEDQNLSEWFKEFLESKNIDSYDWYN